MHCEYQSFEYSHFAASSQHVGPSQPMPPHCPHSAEHSSSFFSSLASVFLATCSSGKHCEYHSLDTTQLEPSWQHVNPVQSLPPHCSHFGWQTMHCEYQSFEYSHFAH